MWPISSLVVWVMAGFDLACAAVMACSGSRRANAINAQSPGAARGTSGALVDAAGLTTASPTAEITFVPLPTTSGITSAGPVSGSAGVRGCPPSSTG